MEQKLRKLEAKKAGAGKERATYYDTEGRGGLKVVQEEGNVGRIGLAAYNKETGCFDIASTGVADVNGARRIFNKMFSSLTQISFENKVYQLEGMEVVLVHCDQLGNFVLVRADDGEPEKMHGLMGKLGIEPDKIVEENFSELLTKAGEKI